MKYEYGEPVEQSRYEPGSINQSDGMFFMWVSDDQRRHRIIACINACAGISNEDLEKIGLGGVAKIMTERDQLKAHHELDNRVIAHLQRKLDERNLRSESQGKEPNGPPLTAEQAAEWEWTGEEPRQLERGESGIRSHCFDYANCCERGRIIKSFSGEQTHSFYWPLRRRQTPKADESPTPHNPTLIDIAGLLQCILDRMPEREVE